MKLNPKTKTFHVQDLLDSIHEKIKEYTTLPHKKLINEGSVKHIARRILVQDVDKTEMINEYLEEVKRNLLNTLTQFEKSDSSMKSATSNDDIFADSQSVQSDKILSDDVIEQVEDFLGKGKTE